MPKFSITISGDTLDELYSSAAKFAGSGAPTSVHTTLSGYTDKPLVLTPGPYVAGASVLTPPTGTHADPVNIDPNQSGSADLAEAVNGEAPEFDGAGIPWDERIHSSSKAINEDKTWRKRRGVNDVYYASVMAELTERAGPGQQPASPPMMPVPPVPQVPLPSPGIVDSQPLPVPPSAVVSIPPVPTAAPVPPVAAVPAVPEAPPTPVPAAPVAPEPVAAVGMPFSVFMPKIAQAMAAGKFTPETLNGWCVQWGMQSITQFQADPAKAELFHDWLKTAGILD